MKTNTSKKRNFYTQGQRFAARVLFIIWLLASGSPEGTLATPKRQMTPVIMTSPGDPCLASTAPLPGGILQLPPDSPGAFWGGSIGSSPSIGTAPQERISHEAAPFIERDLLRTSPKASPVSEHFSFEARGGERVRFACQQGQWHAEVSSRIGAFSRRAVLPVVCSQDTDVASSLEVLSRYPSWQRQRQIHVLDGNVCPTLGEVVYVGELGLKGGGEGEGSGNVQGSGATSEQRKLNYDYSIRVLEPYMAQAKSPQSTKALVEAFNSTQDEQERDALARWLQGYIDWFNDQLVHVIAREDILREDICEEYRSLAHIVPTTQGQKELLRDHFSSLASKLQELRDGFQEKPLIKTLSYALQQLPEAVFGSDPGPLTQLVRQLLEKLNVRNTTFTQATYPTYGPRLDGLYQALLLIQEIDPDSWDVLQKEELYQQFRCLLAEIQEASEAYYPIRYHAKILLQSLRELESNPGQARGQDYCRRTRQFVVGLFHLYQGARVAAVRDVDIQALQKAYKDLRAAFASARVDREAWYEWHQLLRGSCMLALKDDAHYPAFEQDCQELVAEPLPSGANTKALCYGFVLQLRQLAMFGPTDHVRKESLAWLKGLSERNPWSSDGDLMKGLLDSLASVHLQGVSEADQNKARGVLERLTEKVSISPASQSATPRGRYAVLRLWLQNLVSLLSPSLQEAIAQWLGGQSLEDKLKKLRSELPHPSASSPDIQSDRLFIAVQQKLQEDIAKLPVPPMQSEEVCGLLRSYYSGADFPYVRSLFDEERSKHVQDLHCQLMLFKQQRIKEDKNEAGDREDQLAKHHERLEWAKTPIALEDLFKKRSIKSDEPKQEIHKVLLTGDLGTENTILSKKLAYEWSQGKWGQEFEAVYLLPVRNLQQGTYDNTLYRREETLPTAIVNNCFTPPSEKSAYKRLRNHIKEELKKPTTLVILDGLDERTRASQTLLSQAQEGNHKLLMLSRPYGIETERRLADIEIEHAGFNEEQLKAYVQQEVPDGKLAEELLGYIQKHENIRAIVHVPVNLQILCALWQDERYGVGRQELQQGSLSSLYRLFTQFILKRYTKKWGLADENEEELFDTLGQIALAALEQGEILVSPGLVHQCAKQDKLKAKLKDAGFLLFQSIEGKFYQFPHLTFQEYFAGRWLACQFIAGGTARDKVREFLTSHKYAPQYERTLSFLAGEVSKQISEQPQEQQHSTLQQLMELVNAAPVEVVGVQQARLQVCFLEAWLCLVSSKKDEASLKAKFIVLDRLQDWFKKGIELVGKRCEVDHEEGKQLLDALSKGLSHARAVLAHVPSMLAPLYEALKDKDRRIFLAAANALDKLKKADPSSLALLLEAAKDQDWNVREAATNALGSLATIDPTSLKNLHQAAKEQDSSVRCVAVETLGKLAAVDPASLTVLHQAAKEQDSSVRRVAVETLGKLATVDPASLTVLHQAAKDLDKDVRKAAAYALGQLKQADSTSLAHLHEALKDLDKDVRKAAAKTLGQLKQVDSTSLAHLHEALKDLDKDVRKAAAEALGDLGTPDPTSLTLLLEAAKDGSTSVRYAAARSLRKLKIVDSATLTLWHEALKDPDKDVRYAAARSLDELKIADPATLTLLHEALKDPDSNVRREVARSLGQLAPADPKAVTLLHEALKDQDEDVREVAVRALGNLELLDPATLPLLHQALKDKSFRVRSATARALAQLKQADSTSLALLHEALQDTSSFNTRSSAIKALGKLAPSDPRTLTLLHQALEDQNQNVRSVAAEALGDLGTADPATLSFLHQAFQDQEAMVRLEAARALGKLAPGDPRTLILLHQALEDPDKNVRSVAARTLKRITIEQLIDGYWVTKNKQYIPHIVRNLYHMPLVVHKGQAKLYLQAGKTQTWEQPEKEIEYFVQLIKEIEVAGIGEPQVEVRSAPTEQGDDETSKQEISSKSKDKQLASEDVVHQAVSDAHLLASNSILGSFSGQLPSIYQIALGSVTPSSKGKVRQGFYLPPRANRPKPSKPSLSQAPNTSQAASPADQATTTTDIPIRTSTSTKGKEPYRPQLATRTSDLGLARRGQLAESKGPTQLELDQIEAKRLKKQIDQLYPKLSEATNEADAQQLVEGLITPLERLVELEVFCSEDSLGKACAQDYLAKLWEGAKSRKLALDQTRDQQLIQLLERSYSGSLKQLISATESSQRVQLIEVLEKLAALSFHQGAITQDLSHYTDAAILYQHILSICAKDKDTLDSEEASALQNAAYQGLAQLQASMLTQAKGVDAETTPPEDVATLQKRIAEDRSELESFRADVKPRATNLVNNLEAVLSSPDSLAEAVKLAEEAYILGSQALFDEIAHWMSELLARLYQESEEALGPAPCKYAVIGLGSMALQQITPYSDLEFAILMEDAPDENTAEEWRKYFRKLTHLVHLRVINLGEDSGTLW